MVEVFQTNVRSKKDAQLLIKSIAGGMPSCKINIDLDDCDKVLRIESCNTINCSQVIEAVKQNGFQIQVLED